MVIITPDGELVSKQCVPGVLNPCIFEYIYLARPDSVLNGISVYNFQLGLGTRLAERIRQTGWDVDVVVPVPDGSRPAAIQVCAELGLPYREGLVKNRYVGRTFIMPDQRMREMSVRRKLNAMPVVFEGRSVLLIDDSIVRGTTMAQIVDMVRRAGARKVRFQRWRRLRTSLSPQRRSCFVGLGPGGGGGDNNAQTRQSRTRTATNQSH